MDYKEKTVCSETKYEGSVIRAKKDTVRLPNGKEATRDIVEHPGGVAIVALTPERKVVLVNQYRRPFDTCLWEIPAGKLEYGEDHYSCGLRELSEETGYTAGHYEYWGDFYPTPGFCNEKIHIYYADQLSKGEVHLDEDEFLNAAEFTVEEAMEMIQNGTIKDSKTVIGLLMMKNLKKCE